MSRTPLREAIRLLEQDGLVRVSNGNRTVEVVHLDGDELRELYEIREVVDGLAARLLARRGMPAGVREQIEAHLHQMVNSVYPLRGDDFFTAHLDFHSEILLHCGNQRLQSQLHLVRMTAASLRDEFPLVVREGPRMSAQEAETHARTSNQEHRAIFEAIDARDEALAERVARQHIARTIEHYLCPCQE